MKKIYTTLLAIFAIIHFSYSQETLQTVTDRGASTTQYINVSGLDVNGNGISLGNSHYQTGSFLSLGYKGLRLGYNYSTNNAFIAPVEGQSLGLDISTYYNSTWSPKVTFKDNGNVGIGTTSPQTLLDVNSGILAVSGTSASFGSANRIQAELYNPTTTSTVLRSYNRGTTAYGDIGISELARFMVQGSTGNVGIGTTSPSQKLTVLMDASTNGTGVAVQAINSGAAGSQPAFAFLNPSSVMRMNSYLDVSSDTYNIGNAAGASLMTINQSGKVGIGTTSANGILHIHNNVSYADNANNQITMSNGGYRNSEEGTLNTDNAGMAFYFTNYNAGGKVYDRTLDIRVRGAGDGTFGAGMIRFFANDYTSGSIEREIMRIHGNGNVGIGTTSPDAKLAVKGTIHTQEVKVDMTGWNDYVFDKTYRLPTLSSVKTYIDQNHHLPEIPSEAEVIKNGVNLGEMVKLQTKKIEELTLYLIEKDSQDNKKNAELKAQQIQLIYQQEQINQLKVQLATITKTLNKN